MIKKLVLSFCLFMSVSNIAMAAPTWTPYAKIQELQTLINGEVWVILYNYTDSSQSCPQTTWLALKADTSTEVDGVNRVHKALVEAFSNGNKVKLLLDGCTTIQEQSDFPKIKSVEMSMH